MTSVRGRLGTGDPVEVVVEGGRITAITPIAPYDEAPLLLPGLVDIHCHGGGGASFTSGDPDQVRAAAAHHLARGTTSLIGSAVTDAPERMLQVIACLADGVESGDLAGVHVEGPFLSVARCGAQDPAWLVPPDLGLAAELIAAGRGHVRHMTVAPELPGADALAEQLAGSNVVAAVGHTDADAATARAFLRAHPPGLVTHLFNGMAPIHHRSPGPAMAALGAAADSGAVVELIADGVHLDDDTVAAVLSLARGNAVLVTDAMAAAGLGDGEHRLGPQSVVVRDGVARLAHGDSIAGGTSHLLDVVRRAVHAGIAPDVAVRAATSRPAEVLGLAAGTLEVGSTADLLLLDPGWQLISVMKNGTWVS